MNPVFHMSSILGLKILWDMKSISVWDAVFAHAMVATPLSLEFFLPVVKLRQRDPLLLLAISMAMVHGAMPPKHHVENTPCQEIVVFCP